MFLPAFFFWVVGVKCPTSAPWFARLVAQRRWDNVVLESGNVPATGLLCSRSIRRNFVDLVCHFIYPKGGCSGKPLNFPSNAGS